MVALLLGILYFVDWRKEREEKDNEAVRYAIQVLQKGSRKDQEGYWVGDVAGLFSLGAISRDLAEADTAPITPLVNVPRPFHGYYVRVMESGPSSHGGGETILKGKRRSQEAMAFCLYPADGNPVRQPIIISDMGTFPRADGHRGVVLQWPTDAEIHKSYRIID